MTEEKEKRLITRWQKSDDNLVPPQYLAEVRCGDKDQCPGSPTLTNTVFIRLIRGTSALHLNEPTWIIDGSNELIVDFLFALVLFLDSTQPRPLKYPK